MCANRFFRISAANIGPNRFHQNRTVSWLMSATRSAIQQLARVSGKGCASPWTNQGMRLVL